MITKTQILEKVSEVDIYAHYVPDFDEDLLEKNRNITSVFNIDEKNPSLSLYRKDGKILFKCFSTGNQGDCFQLVASLNQLDNRTDFSKVLETVIQDMNILLNDSLTPASSIWKSEYQTYTVQASSYWKTFGVEANVLTKYNVRLLSKLTYRNANKFDYIKLGLMAFEFNVNGRKKTICTKTTPIVRTISTSANSK